LVGPAGYLAEQVVAYAELGVADVSVRPGQTDGASHRTVEALGTVIIPELRAYGKGMPARDHSRMSRG
jgi:hypothetical protein